jgi:hypothetical protein
MKFTGKAVFELGNKDDATRKSVNAYELSKRRGECTVRRNVGGSMTSLSKKTGRKRGEATASSVSLTITSDVTH